MQLKVVFLMKNLVRDEDNERDSFKKQSSFVCSNASGWFNLFNMLFAVLHTYLQMQ